MKRAYRLIVVVGVVYFALFLYAHVMPEFLCIILSVMLFVILVAILLVALISGFTRWRKRSRLWFVPALVCLTFILSAYLTPSMGKFISDWRFGKHLAEYSRVVNGLRYGTLSCSTPCEGTFGTIHVAGQPAHIRKIKWSRCDDGGVFAVFLVRIDVPLVHEGYFLKSYGENSNCNKGPDVPEKQWYVRHISGQWYHFSDQPDL